VLVVNDTVSPDRISLFKTVKILGRPLSFFFGCRDAGITLFRDRGKHAQSGKDTSYRAVDKQLAANRGNVDLFLRTSVLSAGLVLGSGDIAKKKTPGRDGDGSLGICRGLLILVLGWYSWPIL